MESNLISRSRGVRRAASSSACPRAGRCRPTPMPPAMIASPIEAGPCGHASAFKADVSPDSAGTTSPIPSSRPSWDHLPVVRRCSHTDRLQGRESRQPGITAFVFPGPSSAQHGHLNKGVAEMNYAGGGLMAVPIAVAPATSCPAGWWTPSCSSPSPRLTSRRPRRCAATARSGRSAWPGRWTGASPGASGAASCSSAVSSWRASGRGDVRGSTRSPIRSRRRPRTADEAAA